jgi:hypothetical protein
MNIVGDVDGELAGELAGDLTGDLAGELTGDLDIQVLIGPEPPNLASVPRGRGRQPCAAEAEVDVEAELGVVADDGMVCLTQWRSSVWAGAHRRGRIGYRRRRSPEPTAACMGGRQMCSVEIFVMR